MSTEKTPEQLAIAAKMDAAADVAAKELQSFAPESATVIGGWVKKHFAAAGYKRLARLLVQYVSTEKPAKKSKK